jgi:hypothetical protein
MATWPSPDNAQAIARSPSGSGSVPRQIPERRQVDTGRLEAQGRAHGDQQERIGQGSRTGAGAEGDAQLDRAEDQEDHGLPGAARPRSLPDPLAGGDLRKPSNTIRLAPTVNGPASCWKPSLSQVCEVS